MTFFLRPPFALSFALALASLGAGCKGSSDVPPFDGGGGDGSVHFDATMHDGATDAATDGADDLGTFDMCGTTGCLSIGPCRAVGAVVTLDTDTRPMPSGVSTASTSAGHVVAFHGFRLDGTNVVTRPVARDGTAGAEHVDTTSILFARNPSLALGAAGGVVVYETNDPGPGTEILALATDGSGVAMGAPQPLATGTTEVPRLPRVVVQGTGFVGAWLSSTMPTPTTTGPAHVIVQELAATGAVSGASHTVSAPGMNSVVTFALATGAGEVPALVTVEGEDAGTNAVRVRPLGVDGTPGTAVDIVTARAVNGGVTGIRSGAGTLVAWGESIGGSRREVHLVYATDSGTLMGERVATLGMESGSDPQLAVVPGGIVLAYRGANGADVGVRAVGVNVFGALGGTAMTVLAGGTDPAHLALSAIDPSGVIVALADDDPAGGSRVRAVAVDCGGM